MTRVLHVVSSPRSSNSQSQALADAFLTEYRATHPETEVETFDLFDGSLPPFGVHAAEAKIASFFGQEHTPEQQDAWDSARAVFDRFASGDVYVFNIPMWNHGVPYALKQLIDIITQPGWAFGFHPSEGYSGLLQGKKAVVFYTSGVYADGRPPSFGTDFLSPYFEDWLAFVGITDVQTIKLYGQVLDPEAAAAAEVATKQARALASTI